jgi:O-antigen biosynthesis protein WbqP
LRAYEFKIVKIKRIFDLILGMLLLMLLISPMLVIGVLVLLTSNGPSIYWSDRVGKENLIFKMPKFRSMLIETPDVASHLLRNPDRYLTSIGGFLRSSSLDELPQLFSILKGDMSFVGPRPALFNQEDLIASRTEKGVSQLLPGITGWAQINGRDHLSIKDKVRLDEEYLYRKSFWFDLSILYKTAKRVIGSKGISH